MATRQANAMTSTWCLICETENSPDALLCGECCAPMAIVQDAFAGAEVPLQVNRVGSMMTLFFNPGEVTGWSSVSESDREGFGRFFHRMLDEGVYLPPSPFEAMFVSAAHTDADIDATVAAAAKALG